MLQYSSIGYRLKVMALATSVRAMGAVGIQLHSLISKSSHDLGLLSAVPFSNSLQEEWTLLKTLYMAL